MRVVFAGTPEFAVSALDALHGARHEIAGVFTRPDRPAGRGQKLSPSAVALRAQALGLPLLKPERLDAAAQDALRALAPEVMVVVAYGLILPAAVLSIPRHGCLNIHASLLPRWRGAAPIQRCLLAGDRETGITIMRMDAGLDTGPMLLQRPLPIAPDATAAALHDALATLGARLIVEALERLQAGRLDQTPQPADGATYAPKLTKDEAHIDWQRPAVEIARAVRAYDPFPVAWTLLGAERVRIHKARALDQQASATPGSIVVADDSGLRIATGIGLLEVLQLQFPGGRVLTAQAATAGRALAGLRCA